MSDLAPLARLQSITSLDCSGTSVSDLAPLARLQSLTSIDCSGTSVSDLAPLARLQSITSLHCSGVQLQSLPHDLVWLPNLSGLFLHFASVPGLPKEILSQVPWSNCLEAVRAHLRDLAGGHAPVHDVKLLVLGNGRIGKTQICRRLRGLAFDANEDSTHGISVISTPLSGVCQSVDESARLDLWDFGGQDLYHGTHGLFLRTRSLFLVAWESRSEETGDHEHKGLRFRNHRLPYWLQYVLHASRGESPVVVVQNQCEEASDEAPRPPAPDALLKKFPVYRFVHYSALRDRGRQSLDGALATAVEWLRTQQGEVSIGAGRMRVKRAIEALRDADADRNPEDRKDRTISQARYRQICMDAGGVSSPEMLLRYLHECGVVFHQQGLFGDRIILDQAWALDAIYAVFHREKCYNYLRQDKGRFTRTLLGTLVWQEYGVAEQDLFLSIMQSCGICFPIQRADDERGIEAKYIAPELLPDRAELEYRIARDWNPRAQCHEAVFDLPFLHPGALPRLISQIGELAGEDGTYWKDGALFYDRDTRSWGLIEQRRGEDPETWSGAIVIRTQGGQAADLLERLCELVERHLDTYDARMRAEPTERRPRRPKPAKATPPKLPADGNAPEPERPAASNIHPGPAPRLDSKKRYCVSYAWTTESQTHVEALCVDAERRGIEVLRDTKALKLGDRLYRFMRELAKGDRISVILSDKYLRSPNCMFELYEIWRNSRFEDQEFAEHIRVFALPDAKIWTLSDQLDYSIFWEEEAARVGEKLKKASGPALGPLGYEKYRNMSQFASQVGRMLDVIVDTFQPRKIADYHDFTFGD